MAGLTYTVRPAKLVQTAVPILAGSEVVRSAGRGGEAQIVSDQSLVIHQTLKDDSLLVDQESYLSHHLQTVTDWPTD